jgi:hypothetical protein
MLDQYKIVDLPKVAKAIHLGELAQINPSLFVVEVDANSPDDLADMVDLFGSLQTDHYFVVVNKGVNIKEVVEKAREYWAEEERPIKIIEDGGPKDTTTGKYIKVTQLKPLDAVTEEELPQYGERKEEVWDAEYRTYNESRPK